MIIYERILSVCVFATVLMDMVLPTFTYAHTMFMNFSSTLMRARGAFANWRRISLLLDTHFAFEGVYVCFLGLMTGADCVVASRCRLRPRRF